MMKFNIFISLPAVPENSFYRRMRVFLKIFITLSILNFHVLYSQFVDSSVYIGITEENDYFTLKSRTDRYYSNGTFFSVTMPESDSRDILINDLLIGIDSANKFITYCFSHQIYTPENLAASEILPNDRPYAGWTYISMAKKSIDSKNRIKTHSELILGIIGRASLAEEVQEFLHKYMPASVKPQGWHNQIGTDIGINYSFKYEFSALSHRHLKNFDIIPSLELNLGSVINEAGLGLRINLTNNDNYFSIQNSTDLRINIFSETNLRTVLSNSLLEGGFFNHNNVHTILKDNINRIYLNGEFGVELSYQSIIIRFCQLFRTPEFDGAKTMRWGKFSLFFKI